MEMVKNFRFKKSELGYFNEKNSNKVLENFQKGCRIIGFTNGDFSLIDLIYSILKKTKKANVKVATWSAGIKDVHQVKWMIESDLINDFKILTDHSYKNRQKKYAASIEDLFGLENIRTSEMHSKFVLIENQTYKVAITTSMNLNANKTCELFEINEGDEVFDFLNEFVLYTFKNMENGFVDSSKKVNDCVKEFFNKNKTKGNNSNENWWEFNCE